MKRLELAFLLLTPRLCAQPPVTITESSYEQDISQLVSTVSFMRDKIDEQDHALRYIHQDREDTKYETGFIAVFSFVVGIFVASVFNSMNTPN